MYRGFKLTYQKSIFSPFMDNINIYHLFLIYGTNIYDPRFLILWTM